MITDVATSGTSRSRRNLLRDCHMWSGFVWKQVLNRSRIWCLVGLIMRWPRSDPYWCLSYQRDIHIIEWHIILGIRTIKSLLLKKLGGLFIYTFLYIHFFPINNYCFLMTLNIKSRFRLSSIHWQRPNIPPLAYTWQFGGKCAFKKQKNPDSEWAISFHE